MRRAESFVFGSEQPPTHHRANPFRAPRNCDSSSLQSAAALCALHPRAIFEFVFGSD
jgi:hypothetical protein